MAKRKTLVSLFLCLALMICLIPFITTSASAVVYSDGDWQFTVSGGEVTITAYEGSAASVTIPASLTAPGGTYPVRILDKTFYKNTTITSVTIPSGVTAIDNEAFYGCSKLASVTIPSTVKVIGYNAFNGCEKLTGVTIPNGVETIGMQAFGGTGLTTVTIPASVTSIEEQAFYCCFSLTDVRVFGPVTVITRGTFSSCPSLKSFVIDTAESIGPYAFDGCSGLESITIYDCVKVIETGAFRGCSKLGMVIYCGYDYDWQAIDIGSNNECLLRATRHYIPSTYTSGDWEYSYSATTGEVTINKYIGSAASVVVPATLEGHPVTRLIGTFRNNTTVGSVTIPNGVTVIGEYAFDECTNLMNVIIPSSVNRIGYNAFSGCGHLMNISIPNSVKQIDSGAFRFCTNLSSVSIPSGITSIGEQTFLYCTNLSSITIPSTVQHIGNDAFNLCPALSQVYYGSTFDDWEKIAIGTNNDPLKNATIFYGYGPIQASGICGKTGGNITWKLAYYWELGEGRLSINGTGAMADYYPDDTAPWYTLYTTISQIEISPGVTRIGNNAFLDCVALTEVTIPKSVTSIGDAAFSHCSNLAYVNYGSSQENWNKIPGRDGETLNQAQIRFAPTPIINSITANKTIAVTGEAITWTASATAGTGTLRYCFYIYKNGTIVQKGSYSAVNTTTYTPTAAGTYTAKVFVKDSAEMTASKLSADVPVTAGPPVIGSITANKSTAAVGESVIWTASAAGGTGALRYCFYIYKNGTIVQKGSYSVTNTVNYTPTEAGTYTAKVFVKDSAGKSASKLSAGVTVNAGLPVINSITANKASTVPGETITWTASASGGTGALKYCFYIYRNGTVVQKGSYSSTKTVNYTPTEGGTYTAKVFVKDSAGKITSKLSTGVTVSAGALAINSISASKSSVSVSETITWTASASGGTGTLRYAFYLYKDGTVIEKTGYGFSKTYSYTPTAQGSYRVKVFVKDGNGTTLSKLSGIVLCSI